MGGRGAGRQDAGSARFRNEEGAAVARLGAAVVGLGLAALVVAVAAIGLATPFAIGALETSSIAVRASAAGGLLFGGGLLMGQAFPLGMRLAAGREQLTPWLWAMNGATSVCASVLAVVIALSWSISAAFWTGAAFYGLALAAAYRIRATGHERA